jgi:hypothetical protein
MACAETSPRAGKSARNIFRRLSRLLALALIVLLAAPPSFAYSVLTHEQVVDLAWKDTITPMLLARYPGLTPDQLKEAHSYAYGGCVLQDMGYYPHGSHYFSNLLHYVRTGEFVVALLKDSTNADEYAFALGALAHYAGDTTGHPAVNQVTAMQYPKLAAKYGRSVTYDDDPTAHVRVEFGFDVVQVAKGRFQEDDYRHFIGFNVAKDLLDRAFLETYGLPIRDVLTNEDGNINSYRRDVSTLIPKMTRVAWASYGKDIQKEEPTATARKFRYRMSKVEYEKAYGKGYAKPSFGDRVVAFFIRLLPKIGPLKALAVKVPNAKEQDIYLKSLNATVDKYHQLLHTVSASGPNFGSLYLPEMDFDTGKPTLEGEYELTDETYAQLLLQFTAPASPATPKMPAAAAPPPMPADVRDDILTFYSNPNAKDWVRIKHPAEWPKVEAALTQLKQEQPAQSAAPTL